MKKGRLDDNGQFRMRLDVEEAEETPISPNVDDLRIEKLNQRMTLISILIPVLIVVVLAFAYLDIKKRVIQTEDTGQLTAESLSKEVESQFASLTTAQKTMEDNLSNLKNQSDNSIAKVQINLKKLDDRLKNTSKKIVSQKDIDASRNKLDQSVNNVAKSVEDLKLNLEQISQKLQPQIAGLEAALTENKNQVARLEEKLSLVEKNKMDKPAMDVALKLEILKVKQVYKAQLDEFQSRLEALEKKAVKPSAVKPKASSSPVSPKPTLNPSPSTTAPASPNPTPGNLQEQTIGR